MICFKNTLSIIDNSGKVSFSATNINNNTIYNNCSFLGYEKEDMKRHIEELIEEKKEIKHFYNKQLFKWAQTNFNTNNIGNKGTIENISKESFKVIFDNQTIKTEMTTSYNNTDWQKKYYIVDVEVLFDNEKPKVYKIIQNYENDSFSIEN